MKKGEKEKDDQHGETKTEIAISKAELESLNAKAKRSDEYYDNLIRLQAEVQNTKKRLDKEKQGFLKFANQELISRLLPIIDNFDRAMSSVKHTKETDGVLQGIMLVQKELHEVLKNYGVEVVKGAGEKFDPHLHEAVGVVESDEYPDDTVVEELQKGYTMNGRLIRPSKVKVSKRMSKNSD